jgi:hypothetical protein
MGSNIIHGMNLPILIPPIQHSSTTKKTSFPIPTQTGKQPKPKNQTDPQPPMGWGKSSTTHPHKEQKRHPKIGLNNSQVTVILKEQV